MKSKLAIAPTEAAQLQRYLEEVSKIGLRPSRLMIFELQPTPRPMTGKKRGPPPRVKGLMQEEAQRVLRPFVAAWAALFKDRACSAADALRFAREFSLPEAKSLDLALREACRSRGHPLTPTSIGQWLRSQAGQVVDGKTFVRSGSSRGGSALWRLRDVKS